MLPQLEKTFTLSRKPLFYYVFFVSTLEFLPSFLLEKFDSVEQFANIKIDILFVHSSRTRSATISKLNNNKTDKYSARMNAQWIKSPKNRKKTASGKSNQQTPPRRFTRIVNNIWTLKSEKSTRTRNFQFAHRKMWLADTFYFIYTKWQRRQTEQTKYGWKQRNNTNTHEKEEKNI